MKDFRTWRAKTFSCVVLLSSLSATPCSAGDWPQYRGANHDATSTERILKQWTGSATNPVWRVRAPNALCSVAISGGRLFTQSHRPQRARETCVALSITNGAQLWATEIEDAFYPDGGVGPDDGPRSTPSADGGYVFVLTSHLKLVKLNATNGLVVWNRNLAYEHKGQVIRYQNSASPLIENGLIFVNVGSGPLALVALRTSDGTPVWRSEFQLMTHSTPVLATIHGQRQVIFATQTGLLSLKPDTGARLWDIEYPFEYYLTLGISPVVFDDMVFIGGAHGYAMGSLVVQASVTNDVWSVRQLWYTNSPAAHWMTPVAHEGFLYGMFGIQQFDSPRAQLKCVDMRTGEVKWSTNEFGRGGVILVNNHIVALTEKCELVLVKPNTNAYTEVARCLAIPGWTLSSNRCWNVPAVADGRVYARSTMDVACFDFSMPELKLHLPRFDANEIEIAVATAAGAVPSADRVAGLEVRATSDLAQPLAQWTRLTNGVRWTNGALRIDSALNAVGARRFFVIEEPE